MPRKPRSKVPEILRSLFGKRAWKLKDAIVNLATGLNIPPEKCRCRGQGCLGCSHDKLSFLLRPDDPSHYRKLLNRCFVVTRERTSPLPIGFSPTSFWSQREIVERIIEMKTAQCESECHDVICARYDKYEQSSPIVELLSSSSWEFLLNRVGHDLMVYLLQHTSIFLPFLGKKHQQVSGPPLSIEQKETLPVHGNKRKRDDIEQPSKKRQRLSSVVSDCPKDNYAAVTSIVSGDVGQQRKEKPRKRSRVYLKRRQRKGHVNCQKVDKDAPCVSSCNGTASAENEANESNMHIIINGSLTGFAKQANPVKRKKPLKLDNSDTFSVIPPKHILRTLNRSGSKFLMNHIFGEVNAWSMAPSHGKGNCPRGSLCLYHSLLKSLTSIIVKAKSSQLKRILDKHCPVLLPREDVSSSANATSQNSWRQNSDMPLHGSSSKKGKTKCPSDKVTKPYCSEDQVVSFIWAVCSYIVPESLLGTTRQMRVLRGNIAWFISRRRNEKCTVKQFLHKVKPSDFPFFSNNQLCCVGDGHELRNEDIRSTQQMLFTKWISWLFMEIIKKLVVDNFHATESQQGRQKLYYYRKCNWKRLESKEINKSLDGYVQVDNAEAESRRRTLWLSKFRIVPKENGARMVLDFSSSSRLQLLRDTHAVLKDIKLKEPDVLGSSVSDHDDFYRNICPYLIHLKSQSGEVPPLFFVVADVFKAFDSIDQSKLLGVIDSVLKEEYVLNKCRLVCRGKRSNWVNNVLVSSDENATFSTFTSSVPYNALESIMVDEGETHLVSKEDLMLWIERMLKNMLQLDRRFYVKKVGIPQGHKLSSLLCSFYFGHLERTVIYPFLEGASGDTYANECNGEKGIITPMSYKLVRFTDDYLFVSTSRDQATRFYHRLKDGFPDYKCVMNENKFCINFDDEGGSPNRMYVGDNEVPLIRWTGLLINPRTFEIQVDYTRYLSSHISQTFSVDWENKPVRKLRKKLCYFLVPKCHPLLFDSNINSGNVVRLNIYQIFLLAAMKFHCYVYELSWFWKLDPHNMFKFIKRSIRYMFKLINQRMHRINTGSSFKPVLKLYRGEVIWLGLHAYIQVLKKKNSRYRTILLRLKSELSKNNLSHRLSAELEYATDRTNSSSLWKLRY